MQEKSTTVFDRTDMAFLALFFISFFHSTLGLLFNISLLYYWRKGTVGCIKLLIFITTRGILSTAVAAESNVSVLKLLILLATSAYILLNANVPNENRRRVENICLITLFFAAVAAVSSFAFSSYPITALFKIVSFTLPFLAVIVGVAATCQFCRWQEFFVWLYLILFGISFLLIPFNQFRIVNDSFQGVFNHVNLFGILSALFVAGVLDSEYFERRPILKTVVILAVLVMIYLSASRTGMVTTLSVMLVKFTLNGKHLANKLFFLIGMGLVLGIIMLIVPQNTLADLEKAAIDFIWKNNSDTIWESREELILQARQKFAVEPLFGSGFMVPYTEGVVNYSLSFDLAVEPGNLVWAILGDTGIVGTMIFALLVLVILVQGKLSRVFLLVGALMINMGEMVFFSSNNMSVLIYLLIAVYIFDSDRIPSAVFKPLKSQKSR